ncbi:hypothetical protein TNCV_4229301 [Trichonephila clavipes]|nr:hypothetical protein TNCV_4229301 [Trichonephila clavipes]
MGRRSLGHIAIRTRRINFKTQLRPLCSSVSTAKPRKSSFISPADCPSKAAPGRFPSYKSCTETCLQEELMSCLTRLAISEKVRQPQCVESYGYLHGPNHLQSHLKRHSRAKVPTEKRS